MSKQWLHKLKHFGEPGPIDNTDFLCQHHFVNPTFWPNINTLVLSCSQDTWDYLSKTFGVRDSAACNYLYPCKQCQLDDEQMKQRQSYEKNEFLRLNQRNRADFYLNSSSSSLPARNQYAISSSWFKKWEQFVQMKNCPQPHQLPGAINNFAICNQSNTSKEKQNQKSIIYQFNKSKHF